MQLDTNLLEQGTTIKARYRVGEIFGVRIEWEQEELVGFFRHSENCNLEGEKGVKVSGSYGYAGYNPRCKIYTRYAADAHVDQSFPGGEHVMQVLQILETKKPLPSSLKIGQVKKKIAKHRRKLHLAEERLQALIDERTPSTGRVVIRVRQGNRPLENQRFQPRDTLRFEGDGFDDAMAHVMEYYSALREIPGTRVIVTRAEKRKPAKISEALINPVACQLGDLEYLSSGHDGAGLHCDVYEHGKDAKEEARCYPYYPDSQSVLLQNATDGQTIHNMTVQYVLLPPFDLNGGGEKWEICSLIDRNL